MSFPLVHFHSRLFLYDKNKTKIFDISCDYMGSSTQSEPEKDGVIDFTIPFANQPTPSTNQITCHNLTIADAKKFKKDYTVSLWAGWENSNWTQNNVSHIFTSTISTVSPMQNNSGDWSITINCMDGQKFTDETALSKLYKSQSQSIRSSASGYPTALKLARETGDKKIAKLAKSRKAKVKQILDLEKRDIAKNRNSARSRISKERKANSRWYHNWVKSHPESRRKASRAVSKAAHDATQHKFHANIARIQSEEKHNVKKYKNELHEAIASARSKSQHIARVAKRQHRGLRTNIDSKREKIRRQRTKQKSKSKKTKTNGLHFKKNTSASTIIKKLAKIGHIPISHIKLGNHNKKYTSGYTATKTPWQEIKQIVDDCNLNIWWPHGELYIGNFAQHTQLDFTLTPSTGLIQSPQPEDDDDSSVNDDSSTGSKKQQKQAAEANPTKYDATSVFLPFLTTGATFGIQDPDTALYGFNSESINPGDLFSGEVVVLSGELDVESGNMPQCQFTFQLKSALQKAQSIKNLTKSQKAARQKANKDKRHIRKVKAKRTARRAHRAKHSKRA